MHLWARSTRARLVDLWFDGGFPVIPTTKKNRLDAAFGYIYKISLRRHRLPDVGRVLKRRMARTFHKALFNGETV